MPNDLLDTFITGLYVRIDDEIRETRGLGRPPQLSDFELVCLAVAQAHDCALSALSGFNTAAGPAAVPPR
jgi:hypothetical protein